MNRATMNRATIFILFLFQTQCHSLVVQRVKGVNRAASAKPSLLLAPHPKLASAVAKEQQSNTKNPFARTQNPASTAIPSKNLLTASLLKSIVGGGILTIPAAIASLDAGQYSIPIAVTLVVLMASMYAYTFSLLGKVCDETGATSYTEAWEKTMGPESAPIVSTILSLKTTMACVAYSMILADSVQTFTHLSRLDSLLGVTVIGLLPLCLLPDLASLAPFSLAGIAGFVIAAGAMLVRQLDGSYEVVQPIVDTLDNVAGMINPVTDLTVLDQLQPTGNWDVDVFQVMGLACTLAGAFVAHYNAPRIHQELSETDSQGFDQMTVVAFGISALLTAFVGVVGFQTFGADSASVILTNYASNDVLMTICRSIITISLVFTFPLPFVGLRDSLRDRVPMDDRSLSILLLAMVTTAAAVFHDLGLFLQVGGGTVSTGVAAVLPTLMYKQTDQPQGAFLLPTAVMWISIAIGATGVTQALCSVCSG